MHIKQTCVFYFSFINVEEKTTYQLIQASTVSKANRQLIYTPQTNPRFPSINLNLQTEVAQYLVQQGQAKEGGVAEGKKNKFKKLKETYKIEKEHLTYMKKPLRNHAHVEPLNTPKKAFKSPKKP